MSENRPQANSHLPSDWLQRMLADKTGQQVTVTLTRSPVPGFRLSQHPEKPSSRREAGEAAGAQQ